MKRVVASIQSPNATQLGDILKSFSPEDSPVYVEVENTEIQVLRIELRENKEGQYFVIVPSNSFE